MYAFASRSSVRIAFDPSHTNRGCHCGNMQNPFSSPATDNPGELDDLHRQAQRVDSQPPAQS